jgi:hypothetical protein
MNALTIGTPQAFQLRSFIMLNEAASEIVELDLSIRQGDNSTEKYVARINMRLADGKELDFTVHNIWQVLFELNNGKPYGIFDEGDFPHLSHRSSETVLTMKRV